MSRYEIGFRLNAVIVAFGQKMPSGTTYSRSSVERAANQFITRVHAETVYGELMARRRRADEDLQAFAQRYAEIDDRLISHKFIKSWMDDKGLFASIELVGDGGEMMAAALNRAEHSGPLLLGMRSFNKNFGDDLEVGTLITADFSESNMNFPLNHLNLP